MPDNRRVRPLTKSVPDVAISGTEQGFVKMQHTITSTINNEFSRIYLKTETGARTKAERCCVVDRCDRPRLSGV